MKNLLILLLFVVSSCRAQYNSTQMVFQLQNYLQLSGYQNTANRLHVLATNEDYILCSSCTVNGVTVLQGFGWRKWKLFNPPKVDTIWRVTGIDSTYFTVNGRVHSILDSTGGGGLTYIDPGTNVTITGTGISSNHYVINAKYFVDSVYRIAGIDSIYWLKNGITYKLKDSIDGNNYLTGGSYSAGTLTLNRSGLSDITISGFPTTDVYVNAATFTGTTLTLTRNDGGTVTTTINAGISTRDRFGYHVEDDTLHEARSLTMGSNQFVWNSSLNSGSNASVIVNNTAGGIAMGITGTGSNPVLSSTSSSSGSAIQATAGASNGVAVQATNNFGGVVGRFRNQNSTNNTVLPVLDVIRGSTTFPLASGIGVGINLKVVTSLANDFTVGSIGAKWTDPTDATRTGQLEFSTTRSATTAVRLIITDIPTYADETAATTGGLTTGTMYKTSTGTLMIKL